MCRTGFDEEFGDKGTNKADVLNKVQRQPNLLGILAKFSDFTLMRAKQINDDELMFLSQLLEKLDVLMRSLEPTAKRGANVEVFLCCPEFGPVLAHGTCKWMK